MTMYEYAENVYNSLLDGKIPLNKEAYNIIKNNRFDIIITNDDLCLKLIQTTLEFKSEVSRDNRHRASHILITWLLGIGFSNMPRLSEIINDFEGAFFNNLWLQTAMLHDYGYLCKEIKYENLTIEDITNKYDLLTDYYEYPFDVLNNMTITPTFKHFFSYSYDEIKDYFAYSKEYHISINDQVEINDHGIVGGCIAFKKYCEGANKTKRAWIDSPLLPSNLITQIQKIACFIAASHNIYKSSNKDSDKDYSRHNLLRLLSDASKIVTEENSILLLLSLVDTIECTKRFSKKSDPNAYMYQTTILQKIDIEEDASSMVIDFSRLNEYIIDERKNKTMAEKLRGHVKAVTELPMWTSFTTRANPNNDYRIEISLE